MFHSLIFFGGPLDFTPSVALLFVVVAPYSCFGDSEIRFPVRDFASVPLIPSPRVCGTAALSFGLQWHFPNALWLPSSFFFPPPSLRERNEEEREPEGEGGDSIVL